MGSLGERLAFGSGGKNRWYDEEEEEVDDEGVAWELDLGGMVV